MPDAMTDRRVAPRYPLILIADVTDLLSSMKFIARTSDISVPVVTSTCCNRYRRAHKSMCGCKAKGKYSNRQRR